MKVRGWRLKWRKTCFFFFFLVCCCWGIGGMSLTVAVAAAAAQELIWSGWWVHDNLLCDSGSVSLRGVLFFWFYNLAEMVSYWSLSFAFFKLCWQVCPWYKHSLLRKNGAVWADLTKTKFLVSNFRCKITFLEIFECKIQTIPNFRGCMQFTLLKK